MEAVVAESLDFYMVLMGVTFINTECGTQTFKFRLPGDLLMGVTQKTCSCYHMLILWEISAVM